MVDLAEFGIPKRIPALAYRQIMPGDEEFLFSGGELAELAGKAFQVGGDTSRERNTALALGKR